MRRYLWLACLLTAGLGPQGRAQAEPVPCPVDWRSPADSPASVAFLLEAPAAKDGFLRVTGGHLARPDGRRLRLWGVNVTMAAGLEARQRLSHHLPRWPQGHPPEGSD
jgi:hypothetical protein